MLPPPYHIYFRFGIPLKYMSNTNIFLTLLESLFLSRALLERLPLTGVTKESATATHKKCGRLENPILYGGCCPCCRFPPT